MGILVNRPAPTFKAPAVLADGSIVDEFDLASLTGRYIVLFFWPLDFTFVCPSEIIAHDNRMDKFRCAVRILRAGLLKQCLDGGTGRRGGFKIRFW